MPQSSQMHTESLNAPKWAQTAVLAHKWSKKPEGRGEESSCNVFTTTEAANGFYCYGKIEFGRLA